MKPEKPRYRVFVMSDKLWVICPMSYAALETAVNHLKNNKANMRLHAANV